MVKVKKSLKKFTKNKLGAEIKTRKKYQIRRDRREGGKKRRVEPAAAEPDAPEPTVAASAGAAVDADVGAADDADFEAYLERELRELQPDEEDDDDDDEDEVVEDGDGGDEGGVEGGGDDAAAHEAELAQLAQSDPEFYAYLQTHDPALLQWDAAAEQRTPDSDSDSDSDSDDGAARARVRHWMAAAAGGGARALRSAWRQCHRAARHYAGHTDTPDDEGHDDGDDDDGDGPPLEATLGWALGPGLALLLRRAGVTQHKRNTGSWADPALRVALQHCLATVSALLSGPADAPWTQRALLALARRPRFWLLVGARPRLLRRVAAPLLQLWLSPHAGARGGAHAVLARALPFLPHPHGGQLVHYAGLTLWRSVRAVSAHTAAHYGWLAGALADLQAALPPPTVHALLYRATRAHALHLRAALAAPAAAQPLSWPLLLSLRCSALTLARALSRAASPADHELHALLYPVAHVTAGLLHFSAAVAWLPAHAHLLDVLLLLTPYAYVPVAAHAVRLLGGLLGNVAAGARDGPAQALPAHALRCTPAHLAGRGPQRDAAIARLLGVVLRDAAARPRHSAFPEWAVPITRQLRYLCRYAQAAPARRIKELCAVLEANSRHVLALRQRAGLTPRQGAAVAATLMRARQPTPLEAHVAKHGLPEDALAQLLREFREGQVATDTDWHEQRPAPKPQSKAAKKVHDDDDDVVDDDDNNGAGEDMDDDDSDDELEFEDDDNGGGDDDDDDDDDHDDDNDDEDEEQPSSRPAASGKRKKIGKGPGPAPVAGAIKDTVGPFKMWGSDDDDDDE